MAASKSRKQASSPSLKHGDWKQDTVLKSFTVPPVLILFKIHQYA